MTFSPFSRLSFTRSSPMTTAIVGLSLAAVGTAIYLSPGTEKHPVADPAAAQTSAGGSAPAASSTPSPSAAAVAKASPSPKRTGDLVVKPVAVKTKTVTTRPKTVYVNGKATTVTAPGKTNTIVVKNTVTHNYTTTVHDPAKPVALKHCSNFTWQQDAQAAYLANLSDPGALDGAAGPANGDGIACNQLKVDPDRAASVPVDAYVAPVPTAATKAALVQPTAKYFGVAQDGLPGDTSLFNAVSTSAGKAPSSVGWFSGFDTNYGAAQVTEAWSRGALPVVTWMSRASDPTSGQTDSEYTLSKIIDGSLDAYLTKYAGDIVRTNLPVAIRFDHEMNGNWYPWSAGMYNNTPAKYVAAWQHIWNLFQAVGANDDVIWLWSPTRIDNLKPHATAGGGVGQTDLAEDYPGDKYVDWIGASIYLRVAKTGPTYAATFGKTIDALEALTTKPVFIPETAAVETDTTTNTDVASLKASWIDNTIAGIVADPRIIGFSWFNNNVAATVNGVSVTNDWRIDSSPVALAAFKRGVALSTFAAGTAPDGLGH